MAQEDRSKDWALLNVKAIAREAGIPYAKLRNCIVGTYASLTDQEKTQLFNVIQEKCSPALAMLGFTWEGKRIKPKS